jgi:predicted RNA-binding Zn-ribbon protein involved in translation (DUF1610 family)
MSSDKSGCLFVLFHLLGLLPKQGTSNGEERIAEAELVELPYRVRDDFLSPAEQGFYFALTTAVGDRGVVCPKVRLGDLLFTTDKQNFWKHTNRVNQKHVDFVVCSRETLKPLVVIELDDSSHQRAAARERDEFKDAAFAAAGLPFVRIAVKRNYDAAEVASTVMPYLEVAAAGAIPFASVATSSQPTCPKCGVAMVQRTATRGQQAGKPFFGCQNFPKCREVATVS